MREYRAMGLIEKAVGNAGSYAFNRNFSVELDLPVD